MEVLCDLEYLMVVSIRLAEALGVIKEPKESVMCGKIYTRMMMTMSSLIEISPDTKIFKSSRDLYDFHSSASLTRNIIESFLSFYYVKEINGNENYNLLKYQILNYHHNYEKYKLYNEAGAPADQLGDFVRGLKEAKAEIEMNPEFQSLDLEKRKSIKKGRTPKILTNQEISDLLPFNTKEHKWVYRLLSNQVHSTPLAFQPLDTVDGRGSGGKNETDLYYIWLCIKVTLKYCSNAMQMLISDEPLINAKMKEDDLRFVEEVSNKYID